MSFDRDLRAKEKAKYDERFLEMETEAADWIAEILGDPSVRSYTTAAAAAAATDISTSPSEESDLCAHLRDGTILCRLANAVCPDSPIRFKKSKMPFIQMETIAAFLSFCSTRLAIPQHDLFQTIDLYERKNVSQVVQAIHTFSRYAVRQDAVRDRRFLGPRLATSQSREFSAAQMNEARNHVNTYQYGKFSGSTNVLWSTQRDPAGHFH